MKTLEKHDKIRELESELIRQRQYINIVEQSFNSPCCGGHKVKHIHPQTPSGLTDISVNLFQTNIKAKNWIFGGMTQSQLRLRYFSRSASRNVTNCPLETPFFDGKSCINCAGEFPFWDMAKEKCSNCAANFLYNEGDRDCVRQKSSGSSSTTTTTKEVIVKPLRQKRVSEIVEAIRGPKIIKTIRTTKTQKSSKSAWESSSSKSASASSSSGSTQNHE